MWNIIATWIGVIGSPATGLAWCYFAYQQNKINEKVIETETATKYSNHYVKLIHALRDFLTHPDIHNESHRHITWRLMDVCNEAELVFGDDIVEINLLILKHLQIITQQKNMLNTTKPTQQKQDEAQIKLTDSWNYLNSDEMYYKIKELYKKHTKILAVTA